MTIAPFHPEAGAPPVPALPTLPPLPPGRWHGRIWVSAEPLARPQRYLECVAEFGRSGLWPVLIPPDQRFTARGEDWLDDRGRLAPAGHRIDSADPGEVLARWWDSSCCEGACLRPFGTGFPGLARRSHRRSDPLAEAGNTGTVHATRTPHRLGLVQAERPADVPALIGWTGMSKSTDRVAELSAVLRSWEDRFGATLVTLGFDALELSVSAPPRTQARALTVAAEHRAFSLPTYLAQPGTLREYAGTLIRTRRWRFSWA
ncbi:uncharacterized protein DUF4253 [Amycolatopsis sulphurea]|uniref:Uncharacterized protein DUF4253 n=1 Tax=Amycolatopsis sulphurea TaxID=76022 RepID=A0A2A9FEP1_9PSEU|nr:DUF4253 domain-containing protein [Amycolatopsis sulphurea]PFG48970.1 uncharacterized protein DUF4253 [Amycolatopsis sulphurea]